MIVGGYCLHLYCDCEQCLKTIKEGRQERAEIGGGAETYAQASREAREWGWRLSADRKRAYAPGHKIPRARKKTIKENDFENM